MTALQNLSFLAAVSLAVTAPLGNAGEPIRASDLAARLRKVEVKQFAKAPSYTEGPVWRNGELFFCAGALMRVDREGCVAKYLAINPAGMVLRGNGHLLICDNRHKALLDLSPDGILSVIADQFDGRPLKSLNDLTVDAGGNVYWTDPEGSSTKSPTGNIFRVTPAGVVTRVATGLAFPNGLEVDPASKFLYVIESQSKKILRYDLPAAGQPLGQATLFYDLGGSGGDGCAFDAAGNLWVADFHRPESGRGRITVLSPAAKVLAHLDIPAKVVSNLTFGGLNRDELFCTAGTPNGVFHAQVGVKGFAGHPAKDLKVIRRLPIAPEELASAVHPRRFGLPGGVGQTRGWYVWRKWDPKTWRAEVSHEGTGTTYAVRVLPWLTTYRHLAYGAHPDDVLPGERVNLFFNPDDKQQRAYLVHFQDELCQMRGHNHNWQIETVAADGNGFTARVMAGAKPLDDRIATFTLAPDCRAWRGGTLSGTAKPARGERVYLTWVYDGPRRVVKLFADSKSLDAIRAEARKQAKDRVAREGLTGFVEEVTGDKARVLVFATWWSQAGELKPGQPLRLQATDAVLHPTGEAIPARLVSRKNLGTYGSGCTELIVGGLASRQGGTVSAWCEGKVVRVFAP